MNKKILITGSSRGIGKAIAMLAHKQGYSVILHGKSDSQELSILHEQLQGSEKTWFDVADAQEVQQKISALGPIDVLVNNAGIMKNYISDVRESNDDNALMEYKINVMGTIHCIQAVLPGMLEQKQGSIINIASIKGMSSLSTLSSLTFGATKAGVISITKSLAKKYSGQGVRFNAICPGYVETDQTAGWTQDTHNRIKNGTLLGRIGQPEEIAPLVMFLAGEESSYITGAEFLVDGGYALAGK